MAAVGLILVGCNQCVVRGVRENLRGAGCPVSGGCLGTHTCRYALRNMDADLLRMKPIGTGSDGTEYFYFAQFSLDPRLYFWHPKRKRCVAGGWGVPGTRTPHQCQVPCVAAVSRNLLGVHGGGAGRRGLQAQLWRVGWVPWDL